MPKTPLEALVTPLADASGLLAAAAAIVTLGYLAVVAAWPFKGCRRCRGTGKLRSPVGRAIRYCPRCLGSGLRLRAARRVWNYVARLHRDSTR